MDQSGKTAVLPGSGVQRQGVQFVPRFPAKHPHGIRLKQARRMAAQLRQRELKRYANARKSAQPELSFSGKLDRAFELFAVGCFGGAVLGSAGGVTGAVLGSVVGGVFFVWTQGVAGVDRQR